MIVFIGISFVVLIALGMPIAFGIGVSSVLTILLSGSLPLTLVPHRMITQLDSYALLAVPYFILAGMLMEHGGISERLYAFANALTRHWRGGLAQSTMGASIVMSGLSGSGVADISAIGGVAIPGMLKKGYKPSFIASVLTAGGFLGPIIPPSILMIVYGSITNVSIGALFISGVLPGLLLGAAFMGLIWYLSGRLKYAGEPPASRAEIWATFKGAFWALIAPIILIGGIVVGVFTPTEGGAVAALYAFVVGTFVYRELKPRHYYKVLVHTGLLTGSILIIIATAALFGWLLNRLQFPQLVVNAVLAVTTDPTLVLLLVIAFLLAIGTVVETLAAAIILIPVLDPLAAQFGFNAIHYAFVIVLALQVGTVTPPVGVYLFLATKMAGGRLEDSVIDVMPFIAVMVVVLLLVALFPQLSLFLPSFFYDAAR